MSTEQTTVYVTENSTYELQRGMIRRRGEGLRDLRDWTPVKRLEVLPAIVAGVQGGGQVLRIVTPEKSYTTSRLVAA
ncbi:hypothetical protein BH23ACT7_BH23ACT7_18910 [soil metagenome]|jgi:hypothetical protein|nr:hypothetical protein [Euzebyaceae bacterium]